MNSLTHSEKRRLKQNFPAIVTFDVNMASFSRWRVGGQVAVLVKPRTEEEIAEVRAWVELHQLPSLVIGNTTNLLFNDEGVNAIVVQVGSNLSGIVIKKQEIIAKAGVYVPSLARRSMQHGLTGLEHTVGIPGSLGGLVCMNGGSQRKAIGEIVTYVDVINGAGKRIRYNADECDFKYRSSIFQKSGHIIIEVGLKLDTAKNKDTVRSDMLKILRERRNKFPKKLPNCGSVFQSTPAIYETYGPPGRIIEGCGFKGLRIGGAAISEQHANFIVNKSSAKSCDILDIIETVQLKVKKVIGQRLKVEPVLVDENGACREII